MFVKREQIMEDEKKTKNRDEIVSKLNWLTDAMEIMNLKPTPFAAAGGISPSTITRFIKDPFNSRIPRDNTLDTIAMKLGLPLYTGTTTKAKGKASPPLEDGASPLTPKDIGNIQEYDIFLKNKSKNGAQKNETFFWVMKGNALQNRGILDGDILEVDRNAKPKAGDIVCISLQEDPKAKTKTIFRELAALTPVPVCFTATNASHIPMENKVTFIDGITTKIYGVVTLSIRKY